ncbi:MAG TPA: hypothetical protein VM529_05185 [Gemmata sp.]|jgi:hypothetical protein|nr:hypothetical protein [Gemmata sp.]
MLAWALLGQAAGGRRDAFSKPEIIWGTLGLMGALLVGALVVWAVDRWRKKSVIVSDARAELTDFRAMYERGEITEAEYVRLRDRVAQRVKQAPPPAAGGPTGTTPPAPPPAADDAEPAA